MREFKTVVIIFLLAFIINDKYNELPEPPRVIQGPIQTFNRFDLVELISYETTNYCDVVTPGVEKLTCYLELGYTFQVANIALDQSTLWVVNGGDTGDECKTGIEVEIQNDFLIFRKLQNE